MVGVTRRLRRLEGHLAPSTADRQQAAAAVGSADGTEPAARRPFELEDMFRTKSVGGARLSPCGKWLAYTVTTTDRVADSSETALWMVSTEGGSSSTAPVRMTAKGTSAGSPRWSPDGSMLTFLSSRADPASDAPDTTQVWALSLCGLYPSCYFIHTRSHKRRHAPLQALLTRRQEGYAG